MLLEGEEEGVTEDGDWEWDYGEPWEEKQQLVFRPKSKDNTENDDTRSKENIQDRGKEAFKPPDYLDEYQTFG